LYRYTEGRELLKIRTKINNMLAEVGGSVQVESS
jgi:hypothetical protein